MKYLTQTMPVTMLMVAALVTGCQTTTTHITAPVTQQVSSDALQAHNWQLVEAKHPHGKKISPLFVQPTKPLTLTFFTDDGIRRMAFINTCNQISAQYEIVDGEVQLSFASSTRMACPEPSASFDTASLAAVQGRYRLSKNANNIPILTIKNDKQVAYFKAVDK